MKKLIAAVLIIGFMGVAGLALLLVSLSSNLPQILKVADYKPLLVSEVYARGGEKIGEFFRENRILVPYEKIPKRLVQAFISAEDDTFFQHGGLNYLAILRAAVTDVLAGHKVQGGSTITQQVAKSLLLTPEKTLTRKFKEALLALRMEENLKKEEILYLYLNQIYFGEGAHGIGAAADTYFRKTPEQLTLGEMAILAGLPQAPSRYSPVDHPQKAKERQRYVLGRMQAVGFISKDEEQKALNDPITVYMGKEYKSVAPFFVETLRQLLISQLGEAAVLDSGLRIYSSVDFKSQTEAQNQVREGLREVDKREGYRGALRHLNTPEEINSFLLAGRKSLRREKAPIRIIKPDGNVPPEQQLSIYHRKDSAGNIVSNLPDYVNKNQILEAVVTKVDDADGLTYVRFGDGQGLLDVTDMAWARKPDPAVGYNAAQPVKKPSQVFKPGDVILAKAVSDRFTSTRLNKEANAKRKGSAPGGGLNEYAGMILEQDPQVEGALLSFDQKTQDIIAMVGGFDFKRSEYNRAIQANRQTGSSFKSIVYASALDKGYTPATPVADSPIVFEEKDTEAQEGQDEDAVKKYKPHNYENKFTGDILFRNALIRSLNIPTVKILSDIGVDWATQYARRLGIFSPLAPDITLGLGSSGVTLYEMTKVFSEFGRMGQRTRPIVIHKVVDRNGVMLIQNISLDQRFNKEITALDQSFDEKRKTIFGTIAGQNGTGAPANPNDPTGSPNPAASPADLKHKIPNLYFADPEQLISPQTSYLITSLLSGVINDEGGTAGRARALGRPAAGKTGTTNGFYDTWFIGYTPQIATGVWVGFDQEKTLGPGEAGARTALPIWLEYMKTIHENLPMQSFPVPPGIVFANIDNETGKLASASSTKVVKQAFLQGTEPTTLNDSNSNKNEQDFLKEDLNE
jgi:penicillin-binding protein 1A